jgi:hypothetical protein
VERDHHFVEQRRVLRRTGQVVENRLAEGLVEGGLARLHRGERLTQCAPANRTRQTTKHRSRTTGRIRAQCRPKRRQQAWNLNRSLGPPERRDCGFRWEVCKQYCHPAWACRTSISGSRRTISSRKFSFRRCGAMAPAVSGWTIINVAQMSGPKPGRVPKNPCLATPTTVKGVPLTNSVRPTTSGAPEKRRCQNA